ncbi:ABC transporter ATP-binding protein [bacterium]|nr:ABC transporter ATP-binding protein [bacterium]
MAVAVELTNLERRFGAFVAVDRISLSVREGEIFGFLGPNGAGKSTTIRMLCGILTPSGGSGSVAGFDIRTQSEQIKQTIGYMSQRFSLYEDLTVEENINFFSGIYRIPAAKRRERKEWAVEMAGLKDHRAARTSTLSGGWKQRLALGCAILHEPRIVFLDEPTSGVDPLSRRRFWTLIHELAAARVTVFVTTHYMEEAEYCDRIGLIYRGQLIALGTPHDLKTAVMKDDVLEVECAHPMDALDALRQCPSVREAALFGNQLHIVAAERARTEADLRALLEKSGCALTRIERITPSLEDVFVSLVEAHDRDNGRREHTA